MYPSKEHLSYGIFVKNQVEQLNGQGIDTVLAVNANPNTGKVNVLKKYASWALQVLSVFRKNKKVLDFHIVITFSRVACLVIG